MNIDVGQVIAGKYELVKLLGKGAMGEVWLATHNSLGGEFAIKLVEPTDDIEAETAAGRFQLEAQIAAKLSRKTRHIVSVSDHGEEDGLAYLVMELLEGESLEARTKGAGPLELADVAAIVSQVARALSLAHEEGIFHRDLKPANVWLGRDEDGRLLVKLLDFGIARSIKPFRTRSPFATSKDMVLGTPSYMSPEQARGLDTLDYRCDLWALAVLAYEALTRRIPFEGETVEDIFLSICTFRVVPALVRRPDLPPTLDAFFARAFAPKLDERFGSAIELTEAFEQLVAPEALEAALGISLMQASARRRSNPNFGSNPGFANRGSNPNFGSSPNFGTHPGIGSAPGFAGNPGRGSNPNFASSPAYGSNPHLTPSPSSSDRLMYGRSSPDFENVALGSPMASSPRRGATGWLVAIAGIIALLGIGILVLVAFRGSSTVSGTQPVETSTPTAPTVLPPVTAPATPTTVATAQTALAPPETPPPSTSKPSATVGRSKPPSTPKTTAGVTPPAPPQRSTTPPTPAPPTPTPAPAKTVNKSEVL